MPAQSRAEFFVCNFPSLAVFGSILPNLLLRSYDRPALVDAFQITERDQLEQNIAERCCLHRTCKHRDPKAVRRHLTEKPVLYTAAEQMQDFKLPACIFRKLTDGKLVLEIHNFTGVYRTS